MIPELTAKEFRNFQTFIYKTCGIHLPETKRVLLSNRLRRRVKATDLPDFKSYYLHITSPGGQPELEPFLNAVTTNETFFFRTEKHFEWFRNDFIKDITSLTRDNRRAKSIRVWSAACSTGEEPYSLAICLLENQLRLRDWKLEVVGTDLSEEAIQAARTGRYGERSMELVSETQRRRYFQKNRDDDLWQVRPAVREIASFQRHNLIHSLKNGSFDCIFIRNVLIYFDRESKRQVIDSLVAAMSEGAYLVVGPSEGIYDMLGELTKLSPFLYQKHFRC